MRMWVSFHPLHIFHLRRRDLCLLPKAMGGALISCAILLVARRLSRVCAAIEVGLLLLLNIFPSPKYFTSIIYKIVAVFFLGTGFLNLGCSNPPKVPPLPPEVPVEEFTSEVVANIYVDGTLSMLGFVKPGANTRYCKVIEALEGCIISGWSQAEVNFFKFGDDIVPLQGREYIRAKEPSFYENDKINRLTRIQRVIDHVDTVSMSLILTDLFQTDSDVNLLIRQIKEKCFQQNLAFGILGIRSEYDGNIYDLGPNKPAIYYQSHNQDESTLRPFYILLLGRHVDIVHFYEQLRSSGLDFSINEFMAYSPYLTSKPVSFKGAIIDSAFFLAEVPNLIPYSLSDSRVKQFRIQSNPKVAAFVATVAYAPAPYGMSFDQSQLEVEISAIQCLPDTFFSNPQAASALSLTEWQITSSGMTLRGEISPALLPGDGLYFYEVVLRPKLDAYQYPLWFSAWDMEKAASVSNGFSISAGRKPAGASTLNLYRLLVDLWKSNVVIHEPRLATLYCYFRMG